MTFSGCLDYVFANNTIVDPGDYVARIVEENPGRRRGERGSFINNIVVFRGRVPRSLVDVREGTKPATFTFAANLWYAPDDPSFDRSYGDPPAVGAFAAP